MRTTLRFCLVCVIAAFAAGCSGGQGTKGGKMAKGDMPPGCTWSGTYFTSWGKMKLTQDGATVVGTFGENGGVIEGTASGDLLNFNWSEEQKSSLTAAKKKVTGMGVFKYRVAQEGEVEQHSFEGTWGYDNSSSGAGKWTGDKSKKDVQEQQRLQMMSSGPAVKKKVKQNAAGSEYVPPPEPDKKSKLEKDFEEGEKTKIGEDYGDLPPPKNE